MDIREKDIFHVHTFRCGHAENVSDEEYIKKAISLGASGIWFTDHAPFPGDPFGNRMKYSELDEYINTLFELKQKYESAISVHIGLETEYFPSFDKAGYYKELKSKESFEMLLLGQHMAETGPEEYTFSWDKEKLCREEYIALGNAQIQGIESGYFDVVAHPDRIFRKQKTWSVDMTEMADRIIEGAIQRNIPLEMNESSKLQTNHYRKEFWERVGKAQVIHGVDAHAVNEVRII
ncbi:PHP domain-containing protein [Butyrivibrio sp. M55]|uniref:PHP domain-containing protein n=1 Tax=Butyrivibrio sp. M55 TaxID=1855323 RepID=UPI0008E23941|nr:PHP domain-containing protein [Butyrivibrio sp. M55]SFU44624.1 histidinol phosphate phosphatase, HisJ family [Butyrivibrio sp. M55]